MKSSHADKMKKLAIGHGEYTMIEEKDFFDVAKKSEKMVPGRSYSNYRRDSRDMYLFLPQLPLSPYYVIWL